MDLTLITVSDMIRWGVSEMRRAGIHYFYFGDPDLLQTSHYLTFFALNLPYDYQNPIYLNAKLEEHEISAIKDVFNKRIKERLPTPYITNEYWYGPLSPQTKFFITKDVFVPRSPIYLNLKDFMKSMTWKNHRILDLGTGSGALGIILALLNPDVKVDLADICPKALKVAQVNVDRHSHQYQNRIYRDDLQERVKCIQGNLFQNIKHKYDFIITVPPHLSPEEYKTNMPEFFHEPALSLRSGKDGFKHIKQIIEEAPDYLNAGGMLAAEIGPRLPNLIKSVYSHLKFEWFKYQNKDWIFSWRKK
jgi:ribosomal protein L3 glutamine methyltransferase